MAWPHIFASLSGSVPASYLDDNFNAACPLSSFNTLNTSVGTILSGGNLISPTQFLITGEVAPTAINGTVNDYNPANLATAGILKLTLTAATLLTGLAGGAAGRILIVWNTSTFPLTILGANTQSAAANRFSMGTGSTSATIGQNGHITLQYDSTSTVWRVLAISTGRELLQANRTYFVSTTGNDSNDGLTSGTALLTVQAAITKAYALDLNGFTVTIQLAAGTYSGAVLLNSPIPGQATASGVTILGDTTTPANVVFSNANNQTVFVQGGGAAVKVRGIRFTGANAEHLRAQFGGVVLFDSCEFSTTSQFHLAAYNGGTVSSSGNYTIIGGAASHCRSTFTGQIVVVSATVTLTGTPAFTAFADAEIGGQMQLNNITFSGSATGQRFTVGTGGGIYTGTGGSATYLPGNSAGTAVSPGWYS